MEQQNFFKKVYYSIKNFDKYIVFAQENKKQVFKYLLKLILLIVLIVLVCVVFKVNDIFSSKEKLVNFLIQNKIDINGLENSINYIFEQNIIFIKFIVMGITAIYIYILYFIYILLDAISISFLGFFSSKILKMQIKYSSIFNLSVYSLTLSIILNILYIVLFTFFGITIKYFSIMYISVAYIYLITALCMIKLENEKIKKQEDVNIREE